MTARERSLALLTGLVLGGGLLWGVVLEPTWERWEKLEEERALLEEAVVRDKARVADLPRLQEARATLDANLRPPEEAGTAPWFAAHLRALTQESGFEPTSLRFLSTQPLVGEGGQRGAAPPFQELRFELRARTSLDKLQDLLLRLVASRRHVRVASLTLTPWKQSELLEANLSLVALAPLDAQEVPR